MSCTSSDLFQLWCAAAVYRSAGRTRDGGSIVGAHSTFYSDSMDDAAGSGDLDADSLLSKSPQLSELNQQIKVCNDNDKTMMCLYYVGFTL